MTLFWTDSCYLRRHPVRFHILDNLLPTSRHHFSYSLFLRGFPILLTLLAITFLVGLPEITNAENNRAILIYVVKRGDTLSEIALRYQVSVEQLRRWNRLDDDRIIRGQNLKLWPHSPPKWYVVRSGDTLSEIASQYGTSITSLRRLNNVSRDRIYPGQKIRLREYHGDMEDQTTYVVKRDETLWDIARLYSLSVSDLKDLNGLERDLITPGQVLKITQPSEEWPEEQDQFEYVVKRGDCLSTIALRFNVGLRLLRELNNLKGDRIYPGQNLQLRPSSLDEAVHIVRPEETLSSIAHKYHVGLADLVEINGIEGNKILVGQKLRIKSAPVSAHLVERGDALWEIAQAYGMDVKEIKALNGLTTDRIYPGQRLKLSAKRSEPFETFTVKKGDYLGEIARLHQMSVAELKRTNGLRSSLIRPGDKLKVRPLLGRGTEWRELSEIDWDDLMSALGGFKKIEAGNGPYYQIRPKAARQKHARYYERVHRSPLRSYKQARKLLQAFEHEIMRLNRLSNVLDGWHFVLDPGHGGLDPGAVVEALDGNGEKIYVVEDEYVYDVALRVYAMLYLHGAHVTMTLLSPNHLIRHSNPPTRTFVNEKNEVYNSYELNRKNRWQCWPIGGRNGNLTYRLRIARKAFKRVPRKRRVFLSFHADIDPTAPEAALVIYYKSKNGDRRHQASRNFAEILLSALGAGAHARGQNLKVLRDNPAYVSVALELRNLAYTDHAWALRYEELRQRDAEKVVKGVLDYVNKTTHGNS
jgi:LysM repeat protein/N-acetylmuramoyl-L-alanine amidase